MKKITLFLLFLSAQFMISAELSTTDKPKDTIPRRLPAEQNEPIPEDVHENPFIENAPYTLVLTKQEKESKMLLFTRPLTEPIWANTNPLPFERTTELNGWGARKQFVTLNFAVYPLADLINLKVRIENCSVVPEIRLVRYWNIIYPNYNSFNNASKGKYYRNMPEFLSPMTVCDAPSRTPQRFYLTFQLPENKDKISGDILVFHNGYSKALKLPFNIKVLPFELKQAADKNYSAYLYQIRSKNYSFYKENQNNPDLIHKAQLNEFKMMLKYGFTRPPTFSMTVGTLPDGTKDAYYIPFLDEFMAELKEAGFPQDSEIPVTGCAATWLYEKYTKLKLNNFHMDNIECDKIPEELYTYIDSALTKFLKYAEDHNYPKMIFNPIDEPSPASFPYVKRIYEIFKKHGLKTFQTSPPKNFAEADKLFDIYNYGAFNVPYEKATSGNKIEYWCYPNDNAYQIKDPYVMCHGGRMTYGFGYWRSGFNCIIPWIWRNTNSNRICNSGGNLLLPDGTLLMTTYWECFRLGVDDMRYIYTLEDAIVKRKNSSNPSTQAAIKRAMNTLQHTWNSIYPQPAYLRDNLLPHAELDALRARIADHITALLKYPESNKKTAPSVIIDSKGEYIKPPEITTSENIITYPLRKWGKSAEELTLMENDETLNVTVNVDHNKDGEDRSGKALYPRGWPRIYKNFPKPLDFTQYSYLEFDITATSNRNIQDDYNWPISITVSSTNKESTEFKFIHTLEPGIKHKITLPISSMRAISHEGLKSISLMQIVVSESNYEHGNKLEMVIENPRFVGFASPTITKINSPAMLALPADALNCNAIIQGLPDDADCKITCDLLNKDGQKVATTTGSAVKGKIYCGFNGSQLKPGTFIIRMRAFNDKDMLSELTRQIKIK